MTRVADLAGAELALWVARALGYKDARVHDGTCIHTYDDGGWTSFDPHKDWSQGGQLMEKHAIGFHPISDAEWQAEEHITCCTGRGPTPLIAAMRALVASVYGDSVPDEVQS